MPTITKITEQKRRANRRSVFLNGSFAFGCNINVIAKFRLVEGAKLSDEQVLAIQQGEVRQECFDKAIKFIERRMHSRSELKQKLTRYECGPTVIESVLDQLEELGYVNDKKFAEAKAESAAKYKHHGPNRARMELAKKGVGRETARRAVETVYESHDSAAMARDLAEKKARSLRKLEPHIAKRRLVGMLLRRGFDYDTIKPVIAEVLGNTDEHVAD
ncbi:MAG: RecX family transcriptional regulator [Burkholderiales bacterium]|nr:RecX family transcriptional regulator [Phycisphaerae bacterium]